MAPQPLPATPKTAIAQVEDTSTPSGSWKHPKFDEITRRQYATTFDERNVKSIVANAGLLFLSIFASTITAKVKLLRFIATPLTSLIHAVPYNFVVILGLRAILVVNIVVALLPLIRRYYPDDIADIPLTPSQRTSMGLRTGIASPQTPGSAYASPNYVTPPRYQRSTPRTSFSNQGEIASQSPLSGSPRASIAKSTSNSPFSPNNAGSPLFQKAVGGGSATRRLSYDSRGSPMNNSLFGDSSSSATPGTPTPSTGKASVGLNNKWLYEKRRDSPRSSLFN